MKKWSPYRSSLEALTAVPVGPREPCPCGGTRMFKNCCLPRLERPDFNPDVDADQREALAFCVMSAVTAGRLACAELLCRVIKQRWPDTIDWRCSYAVLYEGCGDAKRAAKHWRLAVKFARAHGSFDENWINHFLERADRLDALARRDEP